MISGHPIISLITPPEERVPVAIICMCTAIILSYLFVKGMLAYCAWREHTRSGD